MVRGSSSTISSGGRRRSSGVVFALLVVGFLGLAAGQWQSRQSVRSIELSGASGLSSASVHRVVDSLVGTELRNVSLADVRIAVETIPFVASATVYVTGVSSIRIDVQERRPVAVMMTKSGCVCYVDVTGKILPQTDPSNVHDVPVLSSETQECLTKIQVETAARVLESAEQYLDPVLAQTISELRVNSSTGVMTICTDKTMWKLGCIALCQVDQTFADLNLYWNSTGRQLDNGVHSVVDLRWKNHIIVQKAS